MYSTNRIIRTISLLGAIVLVTLTFSSTARAVAPPPDGGYASGNTAEGQDALLNLSASGIQNTALGFEALLSETSGDNNTATGYQSLRSNTTGSANAATGVWALTANTTGSANTATGMWALTANTTGINNTATGLQALYSNTSGTYNTATGSAALFENDTGSNNTAVGVNALVDNTSGSNNTAQGYIALATNRTGAYNTANGASALAYNTTGNRNTALGNEALSNLTTGSNNLALGASAGTSLTGGSNNVCIAAIGAAGESNTVRIGKYGVQKNTYIAGIRGTTVAGGVTVMADSVGHLGTITSSARFKDAIKPMDKASEAILALKPVTFRYKKELDPDGIPQFGLVAEQVEKVDPDLVARDEAGKPYTVRYEAVNSMLLNEFLKEHRKVEEQWATIAEVKSAAAKQAMTIAQQERDIEALIAAVKAQAAQIQKVRDQLVANKTSPRTVADNQ